MGNDSSSGITIDLDRNNLLYYSGETVCGTVKLNITEQNLETGEIYISITGEVGYGTIRCALNAEGTHLSPSNYIQTQFYYKKVSLSGSDMAEQEFIYNRGQYAWPFRIPLIDHLPPTINKPDVIPRVRYYLEVVIDKPWYKSNIRRKKYLTIYPRVNLLQNPQCLSPSTFECENRKDIILTATMNKLGYVSGENIQFTLDIQNPRKLLIRNINLSMFKYHRIGNRLNQCMLYKITLPKIENLANAQIMEMFSIKIPSIKYPPSYKFQGENANAFVHIYYTLKLTVKIEGVFTNCHMYIPIKLGTESNCDLNQQQTFEPLSISYLSNSQQSISDDDDLPPDYETAIQSLH
jgi:Arrestin (or S-antigen), N-terminal domain/Arrestin (or S-antigen), C-terminal domain